MEVELFTFRLHFIDAEMRNYARGETIERAHEDEREGKSPSTQAGEFVREEIHHVQQGKHGARSTKQAIAIGLSKARRGGVELPAPKKTETSSRTRRQAQRDLERGGSKRKKSVKRSRAVKSALKGEGRRAGSSKALSKQARSSARKRSRSSRSMAAKKAARTRNRHLGLEKQFAMKHQT
jgi:Family of unknown function (DUF6496)